MSLKEAFQEPVVSRMSHYNADEIIRRLGISEDQKIENDSIRFVFREMCGYKQSHTHRIDRYKSVIESALETLDKKLDFLKSYEREFFEGCHYNRDALVLAVIADDYLPGANAEIFDVKKNSVGRRKDFCPELLQDATAFLEDALEFEASYTFSWQVTKEVSFLSHLSVMMDTLDVVKHIDEYETQDLQGHQEHAFRSLANYIDSESPIGERIVENIIKIRNEIDRRRPTATILTFPSRGPQL